MKVVGFFNAGKAVVAIKNDVLVAFDRKSLEIAVGFGVPIPIEMNDHLPDEYDRYAPKQLSVPKNFKFNSSKRRS